MIFIGSNKRLLFCIFLIKTDEGVAQITAEEGMMFDVGGIVSDNRRSGSPSPPTT
jgi:hypothetical protein